jgi:hypothetical protein
MGAKEYIIYGPVFNELNALVLSTSISFIIKLFFIYFFGGLECVGHSFALVTHFIFL